MAASNASQRLTLSGPFIQHGGGHGRGLGVLIGGSIDAFDLGALRRESTQNDAPTAARTPDAGNRRPLCLIELTLQVDPAGI